MVVGIVLSRTKATEFLFNACKRVNLGENWVFQNFLSSIVILILCEYTYDLLQVSSTFVKRPAFDVYILHAHSVVKRPPQKFPSA
jgi:predicted membrane channel-forming protein YqfA (hemolysin III family)